MGEKECDEMTMLDYGILSRMLSNVYGFVCNMTMLPCFGNYESVELFECSEHQSSSAL